MTNVTTYESHILGGRVVAVNTSYDTEHNISIAGFTIRQDKRLLGNITLGLNDAVALAVKILIELDPDRLAPVPFVDLPNGTYLRNLANGGIVQISAYDKEAHAEYDEDRELRDDENWVVQADGLGFVAYNDPAQPSWAVLDDDQVEVETKTTWKFKV